MTSLGPAAKLLGETLMAFLFFGGSKLHGEVEKTILISFSMALEKPYKLLCRCHYNCLIEFVKRVTL
ncbi:hypothetical protein MMA231_04008 (plasmid) [Asticcacaulis sp. MM231]